MSNETDTDYSTLAESALTEFLTDEPDTSEAVTGEAIVLPREMLEGKSQGFIARLKAKTLKFALEKLLGGSEIPTKAPWRSKINALGLLGLIITWFMPKISMATGIPTEQLYEIFGTLFGGLIITLRTWFTTHLVSFRKK